MSAASSPQPLPQQAPEKLLPERNIGHPRLSRREKLNRYGYYTEENVLPEEHLGRLRQAMARLLRDGHVDYRKPSQDQYPNFIEFDDAFAEILDNPVILAGLEETIGPDVQLYGNEVCVSKPTGNAGSWHRDKISVGKHFPIIRVKIGLYLDDVHIDGGPTGIVPESHLDMEKEAQFYPCRIDNVAKAGSLLAFGPGTLHRAGLHAMNRPSRPAMFLNFIPWWAKQASYYTGNRCQHLIDTASPMRRQLLGVELRPGINMDLYST